jgi:dipeptidyl aminopeptidase/acylaminoacyl peptidase
MTTMQLSVVDLTDGSSRPLASYPAGVVPGLVDWRPDGAQLALTVFGQFDPGQTRSQGRERLDGALISDQVYRDVTGNMPPSINPMLQGNELQVYDLESGASSRLRAADTGGVTFVAPVWSTDNRTLMAQMFHPTKLSDRTYPSYSLGSASRTSYRFYTSELQPLGNFEAQPVSAPFSSSGVFVSPDEVIFQSVVGNEAHPYYYNRVSGEFRDIADRAGSFTQLVATRQSRRLIFQHSSFTNPPDLYRAGWDGTGLSRLTWSNEELRQASQTREYPVSFTLRNGQRRPGTLILPADVPYPPKNVRILVWQEGGPGGPMNNQWLTNVENPYALLPNFGFGLLVVPLSGREGNGPGVVEALSDRNNFGQIDIDEQAQIVRQMISRGWTSSPKLGLVGCSYGGYFAWQSIITYPDLYAAANPQCALVDLQVEWSRGYAEAMPALQGRPPWAQPAEYVRDSPSYNVAKVKAAVLSFHGTDDFLPIVQNTNMHLQLVNAGRPARMLQFAGAGHGLGRPDYQLYAAQEQIQWFRTYLR